MGDIVPGAQEPRAGLWPHQLDAVERVCAELAQAGRATAVAACGTGKTLVGAECSARLALGGAVLVLVPTLELLSQTAHAYVRHLGAAAGTIAAVCGDKQATDAAAKLRADMVDLRAPVTTDPAELVGLVEHHARSTVFATYASLPVVVAAHAGAHLAPWDLVVVDEAHRTAGIRGQWAQVHDDRMVPARRRLYLTATPRIMAVGGADIVSMDDTSVFGPQVFHLPFATAIETGLLADYRVAVVTVTDTEVAKLTAAQQVVTVDGRAMPARTLAMQIALAKAIRDYRLRRVITYHGRVRSATKFATGLAAAIDLLPHSEQPPRPVHARWVSGDMAPANRRVTLGLLRNPQHATVVISNARVLAEGVDVPALDAVMFADPRDSTTDVVQAVGRALRRNGDSGKVATIIVPIFLTEGEDPQAALDDSEFDTVWRVVRALRAHDERIADYLDQRRQQAWARGLVRGAPAEPPWLLIDGHPARVGDEFHRSILLRTVETTTSSWFENYGVLRAFHAEHGHADVPYDCRTPDGRALGHWLARCRSDFRAGRLPDQRAAKLAELGVRWAPWTSEWQAWLAALREYRAAHGHIDVPYGHTTADGRALGTWLRKCRRMHRTGELSAERTAALETLGVEWDRSARREHRWETGLAALRDYHARTGDANPTVYYVTAHGFPLGQWLNDRREARKAGRLPADQSVLLEALGVQWHPAISKRNSRWERALAALAAYRAQYGHANVHATYVAPDGLGLGKWLHRRRAEHRAATLPADRVRQLEAVGVDMAAEGWGRRRWRHHLEALDQFRHEHGHANPAQRYRAPDGFLLGIWIGKCRKDYRDGTLGIEQIAELRSRGVDLGPQPGAGAQRKQARWEAGLRQLTEFRRQHPLATIASTHITVDGFRLGDWLMCCRRDHRDGQLTAEQAAALTALGVDLRPRRVAWADRIAQLAEYRHEHGTADMPHHYTVDGVRLGAWLSQQRTKLARGQLSAARAAQLRELGVGPVTRG